MDTSFCFLLLYFCFFKQKTAYEMRISDWSSDVCSSDLFSPSPPPSPREGEGFRGKSPHESSNGSQASAHPEPVEGGAPGRRLAVVVQSLTPTLPPRGGRKSVV